MTSASSQPAPLPKELNFCARMQIALAQLRLFPLSCNPVFLSADAAEAAVAACAEICRQMICLRWDNTWINPELLLGLVETLEQFPLAALADDVRKAGRDTIEAEILEVAVARRAPKWRAFADRLQKRNSTSILLELARLVHASVNRGASTEEPIYVDVATMLAANHDHQIEVRRQLINWAKETHSGHLPVTDLLNALLVGCPALEPARVILLDFLDRLDHLVYVPFVFELSQGITGVCVPVKIQADFRRRAPDPEFYLLEAYGANAAPLQTDSRFREAVKKGRRMASWLLTTRKAKPDIPDFLVRIGLPDLRLIAVGSLVYEQGSIALPAAITLFCNDARIRELVRLNPEVVPSGPVTADSVKQKIESITSVGAARSLLVTPRLNLLDRPTVLHDHAESDDRGILKSYLTKEHWEDLTWKQSRVLSFGVSIEGEWNQPLFEAQRPGTLSKLLPTVQRHRNGLRAPLEKYHCVQIKALAGLGKTWLIAQWLKDAQYDYDLVLHTSVPEFDSIAAAAKWVGGALADLARQLAKSGRPAFLQSLRTEPGLIARPTDLVKALQVALPGKVLWVIDNGQAVVDDEFQIKESVLASLVAALRNRLTDAHLIFVTTTEVLQPELPIYPVPGTPLGFTRDEACKFLDNAKWPFDDVRDDVIDLLGAHPRALSFLVHHALTPSVKSEEIFDLLCNVPSHWQSQIRDTVCGPILEQMLMRLTDDEPWILRLASIFLQGFDVSEFRRLLDIARQNGCAVRSFEQSLDVLDHRSLLSASGRKYWMHSLVRNHVQDRFETEFPKAYRQAHQTAGEGYFPLVKGRRKERPDERTRTKYSNAAGCALALYHFEAARNNIGQQEILQNVYDNQITTAKWQMDYGAKSGNRLAGFHKSEQILRQVLQVYADQAKASLFPGAEEVSWDINMLMTNALLRQKQPQKYAEAAFHLRQVVQKGKIEYLPPMIALLCDIAQVIRNNDASCDEWKEAKDRFDEVRALIRRNDPALNAPIGRAYEKFLRCCLALDHRSPDDPFLWDIINEASIAGLAWDGIYEIAYELWLQLSQIDQAEAWLVKGLSVVPQSARLWIPFYMLRAQAGQQSQIDEKLRLWPRGVNTSIQLIKQLLDNGQANAARECISDALRVYGHQQEFVKTLFILLRQRGFEREAETMIRHSSSGVDARVLLGQMLESQQRFPEADQVYRQGIAHVPDEWHCYVALGALLEKREKWDDAEEVYRRGIERIPDQSECYLALGALLEKQQKLEEAEQVYGQGIAKVFDQSECYLRLGALLEKQQKLEEAEQVYRQGIERIPDHHACYLPLGALLEKQQKLEDAEQVYRLGLNANPRLPSIRVKLGKLLSQTQREEAELLYKEGLSFAPDSHLSLELGLLHELQGRQEEAESAYRIAFEGLLFRPKATSVDNLERTPLALGHLLERGNRRDEAVKVYERAIEFRPEFDQVKKRLKELSNSESI